MTQARTRRPATVSARIHAALDAIKVRGWTDEQLAELASFLESVVLDDQWGAANVAHGLRQAMSAAPPESWTDEERKEMLGLLSTFGERRRAAASKVGDSNVVPFAKPRPGARRTE